MKNLMIALLCLVIVLPNSGGARVNVDNVIRAEAGGVYESWGIFSSNKLHYEIRVIYNTGYIQTIRYEEGERWACVEDYSYLMRRME